MWNRTHPLLPMIVEIANKYGVDPQLAANVVYYESRMNPKARSGAGAMGLMQLMPGTAKDLGVKNPWDGRQNVDGGIRYLAQQMKTFKDPRKALAAYNAGPGNVQKYKGIPPFRETQEYVKRIMDNPYFVAQEMQQAAAPPKPPAQPAAEPVAQKLMMARNNPAQEQQRWMSLIDGSWMNPTSTVAQQPNNSPFMSFLNFI